MALAKHRLSLGLYRHLLGVYPKRFRERFAKDLERDVGELFERHGLAAWRQVLFDLAQSVPRERLEARRRARQGRRQSRTNAKGEPMSAFWFDLRHSLRALARTPVFALVTVALLALGIGANTATFSIVQTVLLRPLPFADAERLVMLFEGIPEASLPRVPFSPPDYLDLRASQTSYEALGLFHNREFELSGTGEPERVEACQVNSDLFSTLRVQAALGRVFLAAEDQPGHDVAVLSYGLWQRRFGGSPDVLGQKLLLDRRPFTVVGVMPASFVFPLPGTPELEPAELFVPRALTEIEIQARGGMYNNAVVARLRRDVSLEQARSELPVLVERIKQGYPEVLQRYTLTLHVVPLREVLVGEVERPLLLLLGAVGLVLLLVCANVANLALSRAAGRAGEMAVRTALGAGRARLIQALLTESVVLALVSGVVALGLAQAALRLVAVLLPRALPLQHRIELDGSVLAFTALVTVMTTVLFGLAPLLVGRRVQVESVLREAGGRSAGSRSHRRLQRALVVSTVALAVVLLVGAGLLARSFGRLIATEPGFRDGGILTLSLTLPNRAYAEGSRVREFTRALDERMRSLPGALSTSVSTALPTFSTERRAFIPDLGEAAGELPEIPPSPSVTWIQGDYFATLGIPLLAGRVFSDADREDSEPVAVISRTLAEAYWPNSSPVGERLKWGVSPDSPAPWMRIVGVVGDVNDGPLGAEPNPHIYASYLQISDQGLAGAAAVDTTFWRALHVAVRAAGDPTRLVQPAIGEIRAIDPELAIAQVSTMEQMLGRGVAPQRFAMALASAFALLALLLAAVGLYGILALAVSQRRRELGVRLALGADRASLTGLLVSQGMRLVALGLALGLLGALAISRLMAAVLFETDPWDLPTFVLVPVVLVVAAFLASYLPARRASRIDPISVLRVE